MSHPRVVFVVGHIAKHEMMRQCRSIWKMELEYANRPNQ